MLFQFALKPLEDVQPWGTVGNLSLHWFGLTDGWSWIHVGTDELFRYAPELLAHWSRPVDGPVDCYPDYQVIRLWEDVWDVSSEALEPIPADVLEQLPLADRALTLLRQPSLDHLADDEIDLFGAASGWWDNRRLSTGHLRNGPMIRVGRSGDAVHVGWDNRDLQIDGRRVWTADHGTATFALREFISEMRQFHDRLASAMKVRVDHVRAAGPPPGVEIDIPSLLATQAEWDAGMGDPLPRQAKTDWPSVRVALKSVRPLLT